MPESTPKLLKITTHWAINFATRLNQLTWVCKHNWETCCLHVLAQIRSILSYSALLTSHAFRFHDAVVQKSCFHEGSAPRQLKLVTPFIYVTHHSESEDWMPGTEIWKISAHLHDSVCSGLVVFRPFQLLWWTIACTLQLWWHNSASFPCCLLRCNVLEPLAVDSTAIYSEREWRQRNGWVCKLTVTVHELTGWL